MLYFLKYKNNLLQDIDNSKWILRNYMIKFRVFDRLMDPDLSKEGISF
jgi:hypothetical protein